jgi:HSP20 family protein
MVDMEQRLADPREHPHPIKTRGAYTMAQIQLYDPFSDTPFDELFRGFLRPVRALDNQEPRMIKVDVSETDASYVVQAEIPGVPKEDIQVTIEGNQVAIGAEIKRDVEK